MASNLSEYDCIDCDLAPCDRESPECIQRGGNGRKPPKPSLADRITLAVRASQAAAPLTSAKRRNGIGNKLDYSQLDIAWFKANARIGGKYAVITSEHGETFAAHGLLLKPQRQGRVWRCQSKDPYLISLVEPGRTTKPRRTVQRHLDRIIASEKLRQELSSVPCQLPESEPVSDAYKLRDITRDVLPETLPEGLTRRASEPFGNTEQLTKDEEREIREMSLQAEQDRKREFREKMLTPEAKTNQEALFDLIERFGMSYHLGAAMEHLCAYAAGGPLDFIEKAMAHLRRIQ